MHNDSPAKKPVVRVFIITILVILLFFSVLGDIQIHNVICLTRSFYRTPNEALIQFRKEDAEQLGIDEDTPSYVLQLDDYNAIVCFVCNYGVSVQLMYTKDGGYHNLGWGSIFEYDNGSKQYSNDPTNIMYIKEKLLRKSGLYGENFEYAIIMHAVDQMDGHLLLTFPVRNSVWTIIARVSNTSG